MGRRTGGIGGATLDPLYVFLRPTLPNMLGSAWDLQLDGHLGFGNVVTTLRDTFEDAEFKRLIPLLGPIPATTIGRPGRHDRA